MYYNLYYPFSFFMKLHTFWISEHFFLLKFIINMKHINNFIFSKVQCEFLSSKIKSFKSAFANVLPSTDDVEIKTNIFNERLPKIEKIILTIICQSSNLMRFIYLLILHYQESPK